MHFYNPRLSMFSIDLSLDKETVQLSMAPTLDPSHKGQPQKGQKMYDWDKNTVYFSIGAKECYLLYTTIPQVIQGQYKNPKEREPKWQGTFKILHFNAKNEPSNLAVQQSVNDQGPTGSILITIIPAKSENKKAVPYVLRMDELQIFKHILRKGFEDLPYDCSFQKAIEKSKRRAAWEEKNKQSNGQQNTSQSYQENSSQDYNQNQQPSSPPSGGADVPTFDDIGASSGNESPSSNGNIAQGAPEIDVKSQPGW